MIRMAVVLGLACILSVSMGCSSHVRAPTPTFEQSWSPQEKPAEGFAIDLPPTWKQISMDSQTLDAFLDAFLKVGQKANPQMAAMLEAVRASGEFKNVKFFAFDFAPEAVIADYRTNVFVHVNPTQVELPLDFHVQMDIGMLENMPDVVKPVTHQRVHLIVGEAEKVQYRMPMINPRGKAMTLVTTWYMIVKGKDGYSVVLNTTADQAAKYAPIFKQISQSFRWIQ